MYNFKEFIDERIPAWYRDPKVWVYLGKQYGLKPGGIIDDNDDQPPIIIVEHMYNEHIQP